MTDSQTVLRGLDYWAKNATDPAVRTDCAAGRDLILSLLPRPRTVACPHWEPGRITMRAGCEACASENAVTESPDSGREAER